MPFRSMTRRESVALLAAALGWPLAAHAQEAMRRIGVLNPFAENDPEARTENRAFRDALRKLGWLEGHNISIDYRWAAGDVGRISTYAKELVGLAPDLIVARSTPVTGSLLHETSTIPIVFVGVSDPVGSGFVGSMARPGGNATGFTNVEASLGGKWVEVVTETKPRIARIGVIFSPKTSPGGGAYYLRLIEAAARSIAIETVPMPVLDGAAIEYAIGEFARVPGGGLIVQPDVTTTSNRALIMRLAEQYRLPAVYPYQYYVAEGGLASYGIDVVDVYRKAAIYIDRILKGEKPADLPVQAPVKFDLAINTKTAKSLGVEFSPVLLVRADEVIE